MRPDLAFNEALAGTLPLPLAQLYRRAQNAKTAVEQHQIAFYFWEAGLKLLAAASLAEFVRDTRPDTETCDLLRHLVRPSLGHWWLIVRRLVAQLAAMGSSRYLQLRDGLLGEARNDLPAAAALYSALREVLDGQPSARTVVRIGDLFDLLVRYRNAEVNHGAIGARTFDYYKRMGQSLLAGVANVFEHVDVLAGQQLIAVTDVRRIGGAWLVERLELRGLAATRIPTLELPYAVPPPIVGPYLVETQGADDVRTILPLTPLIQYDGEKEQILFLIGQRKRQHVEYLCYITGERVIRDDVNVSEFLVNRGVKPDDVEPESDAETATLAPAASTDLAEDRQHHIGEFEIVGELGRGGMGVVYRARQPSLRREVALKVLYQSGNPAAEARFRREIRALGRVDHPNLIKVYTSGLAGEHWYYAMELVDGPTLAAISDSAAERAGGAAQAAGRDYVFQVVELMRQVAEAAHALHEHGILHRDIKPGNVLLTADLSRAVLMDLGLAQIEDDLNGRLTRTRQFVGTLRYASPEQVMSVGNMDRRADIYSLGATLYELLAFRPLFGATDETPTPQIMLDIQYRDPERLRRFNAFVSRDLEIVVHKCLEKSANQRYSNAKEFADELQRVLDGHPISARRVGEVSRVVRWVRRHPAQVSAIVLPCLMLIVGYAAGLFHGLRIVEHPEPVRTPPISSDVSPGAGVSQATKTNRGHHLTEPTGGVSTAERETFVNWISGYWWIAIAIVVVAVPTAVIVNRRNRHLSAESALLPAEKIDPTVAPAIVEGAPKVESVARPPTAETTPAAGARTERPRDVEADAFSDHTVLLHFPAPIAIAYRSISSRTEPGERKDQLVETLSTTLKYLVFLGLSDLFAHRATSGDARAMPRHTGFSFLRKPTHMTLGMWADAVRATAIELDELANPLIPELPNTCREGEPFDAEVKWFTDARNALTHPVGGVAPTAEVVEAMYFEARSRLDGLFRRLTFLRKYHLAFAVENPTVSETIRSYTVHSCMGCQYTGNRDTYPVQTSENLPTDLPFVVVPPSHTRATESPLADAVSNQKLLPLWPFMLQRERKKSEDQSETLYVFDRIEKGSEHLSKVFVVAIDNHHDTWSEQVGPKATPDLSWLWERLRDILAIAKIPKGLDMASLLTRPNDAKLLNETLGKLNENAHDRFRLTARIGGGGFGTVYKAVRGDGREFAVKVLQVKSNLGREKAKKDFYRFHREYTALRNVGQAHTGIIQCHNWGHDTLGGVQYYWYAMDLAKSDLKERLDERRLELGGRLAWTTFRAAIVREFRAIARAVSELHKRELVHRDIKPANVLIVDGAAAATEDELRLADFGLIKEIAGRGDADSLTSKGAGGPGTKMYMAPEQDLGGDTTPKADVYSLGMLLAELALGYLPESKSLAEGSSLEHEPRLNELPEDLRDLIVRCTRANPDDRPENAGELLVRFNMLFEHEPSYSEAVAAKHKDTYAPS